MRGAAEGRHGRAVATIDVSVRHAASRKVRAQSQHIASRQPDSQNQKRFESC
jgi:hypothetical protein